ncbi:hypothetical protein E3T33_07160, partial [Cryobacterium sp. TMT1-2-1]|uniref:hypothetical protein n=1 Tax=Cryobacterium sp. TMT1-2-1 TaxID=1259232 RepID=UPI0011031A85
MAFGEEAFFPADVDDLVVVEGDGGESVAEVPVDVGLGDRVGVALDRAVVVECAVVGRAAVPGRGAGGGPLYDHSCGGPGAGEHGAGVGVDGDVDEFDEGFGVDLVGA